MLRKCDRAILFSPQPGYNLYPGTVHVVNGRNPKTLHLHQVEAIKALNGQVLDQAFYEGLLVLPTGGGKTHTAVQWVLRNVIDKGHPDPMSILLSLG